MLFNPYKNKVRERIVYDYDSFEEALQGILNNFIDLRYEFDKFVNGQPIYIMRDFINKFEEAIKRLAKEIYSNHIKK